MHFGRAVSHRADIWTFHSAATSTTFAVQLGIATLAYGQESLPPDNLLNLYSDNAFVLIMNQAGVSSLTVPVGATARKSGDGTGQYTLAHLSGVEAEASPGGMPGIYRRLPAELEEAASGKAVRVTVVAKRPRSASNETFAVAYSTNDVGNSGWHRFQLSERLATFSFTYSVGTKKNGGGDFIGFLPDPDGRGGAVEIAAIGIEAIESDIAESDLRTRSLSEERLRTPPTTEGRQPSPEPPGKVIATGFYDIAIHRIALPQAGRPRGAIAKIDKGVLFSDPLGKLYYIRDIDDVAREAPVSLSNDLPFLAQSPLLNKFLPQTLSIYDVEVDKPNPQQPTHYDIYMSHLAFDATGECLFLQLSRTVMNFSETDVQIVSPWSEVFRSRPCLPIEWLWEASLFESGGRIAFDASGILLSIGTFNMEGQAGRPMTAQSNDYDYGKIVRLDRKDFTETMISKGHRNVQGIFVDSDGAVIATEHGPRGGDEINIIHQGRNYGWPLVSFGTDYDAKIFRNSKEQGRHSGFEQPIFAFVPAIGISQILRVTSFEQFPIWHGDYIVLSLKGETLYRLHVEGNRVLLSEPIFLDQRLRDAVELDDGRLALLTDGSQLLIFENFENLPGDGPVARVEAKPVVAARGPGPLTTADAKQGEQIYLANCASCHAGAESRAPDLTCVFGRRVASVPRFDYSPGLDQKADAVWSLENLDRFLAGAQGWAPGTTMDEVKLDGPGSRLDIIAYLAATREANCPN